MNVADNDILLDIRHLSVAYRRGGQLLEAVGDFSLQLRRGETYGLVGESGSGKTTVALAIMRYLGDAGIITAGEILFDGIDLARLDPRQMRAFWGKRISLVPQDPFSALNPSLRVADQLAEPLQLHMNLGGAALKARVLELLALVRVPDPARVAASYPHQLSGGMQQRVLIAMALSTEPQLLILDEPTTNLDVTSQAAVLDLFADLIRARQTAALYVTHNLGVVARVCDRVAVLYAGELVADAPTADLYSRPLHPYARGLLDSVPRLGQHKAREQLRAIPGRIPALGRRPAGCVFAPRCPLAIDICATSPPLEQMGPRRVRCHRWQEIAAGEVDARQAPPADPLAPITQAATPLLQLTDLAVHYELGHSLFDGLTGRSPARVRAVDGVTLDVGAGQTLGLVGESGSGKTTLARAIIGLAPRSGGAVTLLNIELPTSVNDRDRSLLRLLQYVFQNPEEALNPFLTVGETLRRPFMTLLGRSRDAADRAVAELLRAVRLPADFAARLPSQLSGGEKQRVAIARAFATAPDLLIADEAVSALDVSVQASVLNLLGELQSKNNNTLLFISHDLAVVGYLADTIAVMYVGKLMEIADAALMYEPPYHPYTEALLSAIPLIDPQAQQVRIRLDGEVPSQVNLPSGCPFHPRCPRFLGEICRSELPPWQTTSAGKRIFCHIPVAELAAQQAPVFAFGNGRAP